MIASQYLLPFIIAGCVLFCGCSAPISDNRQTVTSSAVVEPMTATELAEFLGVAADYTTSQGIPQALSVFQNPNGTFSHGDLYIYAYDFNGILLAHPYQPDKVGTDRSDWTDAKGLPFVKVAQYAAEQGDGFIAYMYPAPDDGIIDEKAIDQYVPKLGHVKKISDTCWIGSGIYFSDLVDAETGKQPIDISELILFVEEGIAYAQKTGKEQALEAIGDTSGPFIDGDLYLYAYDYNGTLLSHPYLKNSVGTNLYNMTGTFGEPVIQALATTAQNGGGYTVFGWENPAHNNRKELKLGYILPVDDRWWLGSGIYLSDITGIDDSVYTPQTWSLSE